MNGELMEMNNPRRLTFSDCEINPTSTKSEPERMRAYVRTRPIGATESRSAIKVTDTDFTISITKTTAGGSTSTEDNSFTFDGVFEDSAST